MEPSDTTPLLSMPSADIYSDNDPSMSAPAIDTIKKYLAREWMKISPGGGGGGGGGCYLL